MTDDHNPFGSSLRDRVRDEHPDLDRLVSGSARAGTRIRRRRQAGGVLATAAAVAAVAVGGDQLLGEDGTTSRGPGFTTAPTSSSSTSGPTPENVNPDRETITLQELSERLDEAAATNGKGRPLGQDEVTRIPDGAPFSVGAPGWTCDPPLDEKFSCAKDGDSIDLVWRDAASRPKYLGPDGYGPDTFVSEAHGGIFVTVEPLDGTAPAVATEVGESLVFD